MTTDFKTDSGANWGGYISADAEIARQAGDSAFWAAAGKAAQDDEQGCVREHILDRVLGKGGAATVRDSLVALKSPL